MNAKSLAKSLSVHFLEHGNYEALGTPLGSEAASKYARAASIEAVEEYFEKDDGFSGLAVHSVGYTEGADDEMVIIYVTRGSKKELNLLPKEVEDVKVQARVMGKMRAGLIPAMARSGVSNFYERDGRIACGGSCAPSGENYSGTLGAFATDGVRHFALSNNHVLAACNHTPVGMPVLAPSTADARPDRRAPTSFGRYERMIELRSGDPVLVPPSRLDAAIAAVVDANMVSSWQGNQDGFDTPGQIVTPVSGMKVKKFGRTSGLTFGTIEAFVPTPWILPYKAERFSAAVWFTDTWTIRSNEADPFALPGDSGSLIVTEDGNSAVGLLFAVNNRGEYGIFMPIEQVLSAFGDLHLLSGHGL